MQNIFFSRTTYKIIRITLGGVFLYSGLLKITDLLSFSTVIHAFGLVPREIGGVTALFVSSAELIAGMGLVLDIKGSLTAVFSMLIMFMLVLLYGILMGFDIDCGCFGSDDPVGSAFHGLRSALVRDLLMCCFTAYLYIWRKLNSFKPVSPFLYCKRLISKRN
ncbi:MAG: DoxX family membrane protein [Desulfamplus sp.]|nr:DoxX family membrane protein [Desulfamplus sp.]